MNVCNSAAGEDANLVLGVSAARLGSDVDALGVVPLTLGSDVDVLGRVVVALDLADVPEQLAMQTTPTTATNADRHQSRRSND